MNMYGYDQFGKLLTNHGIQQPVYPTNPYMQPQYPQAGYQPPLDANFIMGQIDQLRNDLSGVASIVKKHEQIIQTRGVGTNTVTNEEFNPNAYNVTNPFAPNLPANYGTESTYMQQPVSMYTSDDTPFDYEKEEEESEVEEIEPEVVEVEEFILTPFRAAFVDDEFRRKYFLPSDIVAYKVDSVFYVNGIFLEVDTPSEKVHHLKILNLICADDRAKVSKDVISKLAFNSRGLLSETLGIFMDKATTYEEYAFFKYVNRLATGLVNDILEINLIEITIDSFSEDFVDLLNALKEDYEDEFFKEMLGQFKIYVDQYIIDTYTNVLNDFADEADGEFYLTDKVVNIRIDRNADIIGFVDTDLDYTYKLVDTDIKENYLFTKVESILKALDVDKVVITTIDEHAYQVQRNLNNQLFIKKYKPYYL